MKTVNDKLQEIFRLSLKIHDANFYHQPNASCGHVYTLVPNKNSVYGIDVNFRYSDWVTKKDPESLDNAIKSLNNIIINQP